MSALVTRLTLSLFKNEQHVLKREATRASGLQGLTGSSGTRAGDAGRERKTNQDLENPGMIQD